MQAVEAQRNTCVGRGGEDLIGCVSFQMPKRKASPDSAGSKSQDLGTEGTNVKVQSERLRDLQRSIESSTGAEPAANSKIAKTP